MEPIAALVPVEAHPKSFYRRLLEEGLVIPSMKKLSGLKFTRLKRSVRIQEALDKVRSDRV